MSSFFRRREILMVITFLVIFLQVIDFFFKGLPDPFVESLKTLRGWSSNIAAFAVINAVFNLSIVHIGNIRRRRAGIWPYSAWLLFVTYFMIIVGLVLGTGSEQYVWLLDNVYAVLVTTVFSLLTFYLATAVYRSFRARSIEAFVLLLTYASVVASNGPLTANIPVLGQIGLFLQLSIGAAGFRGMLIGSAISMIAMAFRMMIGIERGALAGGE